MACVSNRPLVSSIGKLSQAPITTQGNSYDPLLFFRPAPIQVPIVACHITLNKYRDTMRMCCDNEKGQQKVDPPTEFTQVDTRQLYYYQEIICTEWHMITILFVHLNQKYIFLKLQ